MALRPVDPQPDFPALERAVLERWRERDVFRASVERRRGAEPWVWYEGPPTANGLPGVHHVLARVFKDIFPRYRTMKGNLVERQGGWDCHGLPVEIAVEKELGFHGKPDIEAYGIAEFNAKCREAVLRNVDEWIALTDRIGMWVDTEHAYRTMDPGYVESVWWALKTLWERDLLYEGFKVVPYCAECGPTLSSHELGQPGAYREVEDPSVYVRLPVTDPAGPLEAGDELIVWTTTPWTLVSNAAVAVHPDLTYVRARVDDRVIVVADALLERLAPDGADILARFAGGDIAGTGYEPPFPFIGAEAYGPRGHTVLTAEFVSADDGTGLVHTAIAFGEDDFRLGEQYGLNVINPVQLDGTYDERIGPYAGRWVKDADPDLVEDLRARDRVYRAETFVHAYPHCWRSGTPLIYYAKPSWYIATTKLRDRLLAANEAVDWHPEHIKHGRMGEWLRGNVDWALSRERYWGTPLPVWRCDGGHMHVIGSLAELEQLSGVRLEDPHRPFVDDVHFPCTEAGCRATMTRVPEVIDVWFDSGSMPFAQWHAPHENEDVFRERFPADYICEALDQTRGWFYSLLAISTLLFGRAPYEHVVCLGLILDREGQKMSKSKGNIVVPWDVLDRFGADAFRWYLLASKQPWDGYRFDVDAIGESVRLFLRQLWSTYNFFTMYAPERDGEETDLDRWVRSRLSATVSEVTERLEAFDCTTAGRAIAAFVDDLSNWYVRRSRRRFWTGERAAFATLEHCLVTVAKLLAPFTPFIADEIYDNLDGTEPSVHLCDWPEPEERDTDLEAAMAGARETVRLGLSARAGAGVNLRQPLHEAVVVAAGRERVAIERLAAVVRDELNVKDLRFVERADELGSYEIKPNYRTLGPRFGKAMPQAAAAIEALDPAHVATALRDGRTVGIAIDGHDHELTADDLQLAMTPLEGYQLEREGSHAVALELALDDALRREGLARAIVHAIQNARKAGGLAGEERIDLTLGGDAALLGAARAHDPYVTGETLATRVEYAGGDGAGEQATIDGRELRIALARATDEEAVPQIRTPPCGR